MSQSAGRPLTKTGNFSLNDGSKSDVVLQDQQAGQAPFPGVADHLKMAEQAPVRTGGMPPCRGQFQSAAVDGGDSADPADVMPSQSGLQSPPGIEVPIQIDAGLVGEHFVDVAARTRHGRRTRNQIGR